MAAYKPLQEHAYDHLRDLILSGALKPNVFYSETKMAAEIGISRTPMKDALVRLAQDKYIDIIPSKGFRLHEMSAEEAQKYLQELIEKDTLLGIRVLKNSRGKRNG